MSAEGKILWATNGIPIPTEPSIEIGHPVAISDGSHGAIVAWSGRSAERTGVFAARVTPIGSLPWRGRGVVFSTTAGLIDGLRIVHAEHGGAILGWRHRRHGKDRIVAQRIDHAGRRQWSEEGVSVCAADGFRDRLAMASDLQSGAYFAWTDSLSPIAVYGMHLDLAGRPTPGWSQNGEPIAARFTRQSHDGGMSVVTELEMTTLEPDRSRVTPGGLVLRGSDQFTNPSGTKAGQSTASAMVSWVDDRTPFSIFSMRYVFTMLLEPEGPAARAIMENPGPSLVEGHAELKEALDPTSGRLSISSSLEGVLHLSSSESTPVTLELFDLAGRRVWSRELVSPGQVGQDVRLRDEAAFHPGIYLARVTQGANSANARVAIMR